jgi:UDP-N-acetylmuramoylalanine--D-glutamate ligase
MIASTAGASKPGTAKNIFPAPGMADALPAGGLAVVVGAAASGLAAVRLLARLGARARLLDRKEFSAEAAALAQELSVELVSGEHTAAHFAGADLVVTSPGVPMSVLRPILAAVGDPPLMAEMELALRYAREPVLAVTGSSGKTTTVSLAAAMLEAAGKKVFLGGNIGTPLSDYVCRGEKAEVLVLELSSFQLQGCAGLHPRAAVLLNLTENHLDRHKDMAEYADAKFSLFARQSAADVAVLPASLLDEYRRRGYAGRPEVIRDTGRFARMRLVGAHNAANAEAAFLACREFGVSETAAVRAAEDFSPLRHRLEEAGTIGGVRYVNDSKSTTVDSMRAALSSFAAPVVLLAGGKFKGGDLASLRPLLERRVKAVALFGASREIFEQAWQGAAPLFWDADLPGALARVRRLAAPGDVALLSPGAASYDLYNNYQERGDHFCLLARSAQPSGEQTPKGEEP